MKYKIRLLLVFLCAVVLLNFSVVNPVEADQFQFQPTPKDMDGLDHHRYYLWGMNLAVPEGHVVTKATLKFDDIRNWNTKPNKLYIHLVDNVSVGLTVMRDTPDNASAAFELATGDALDGIGINLITYTNLSNTAQDLSYSFTDTQLTALNTFLVDGNFGIGLDPDCHFWNTGGTLEIETGPVSGGGTPPDTIVVIPDEVAPPDTQIAPLPELEINPDPEVELPYDEIDSDGDGVPDILDDNPYGSSFAGTAANSGVDSDGDGVADIFDEAPGDASLATITTPNGKVTLNLKSGGFFTGISVIAERDLNKLNKTEDQEYRYGFLTYTINGVTPGGTAQINFVYPEEIPEGTTCLKVDDSVSEVACEIDGNTVIYSITDGGAVDADGMVNGVIEDFFGLSLPEKTGGSDTENVVVQLLSPSNGEVDLDTTVEFEWIQDESENGSYFLRYCENREFSGCEPVRANTKVGYYAGIGAYGGSVMLLGFLFAGAPDNRKKVIKMIAILVISGSVFIACSAGGSGGNSGGGGDVPSSSLDNLKTIIHRVSGLKEGTTYYWQIVAEHRPAESAVWVFATK